MSLSHDGSMGLVYLPTWMVDFYGKCRSIYLSHGSYGYRKVVVGVFFLWFTVHYGPTMTIPISKEHTVSQVYDFHKFPRRMLYKYVRARPVESHQNHRR